MSLTRRDLLKSAALASAAVTTNNSLFQPTLTAASTQRIRIGVSTYSYWHFKTEKVPIETVIDKAAEIGVEAVDILHRQMDIPEREPLTASH